MIKNGTLSYIYICNVHIIIFKIRLNKITVTPGIKYFFRRYQMTVIILTIPMNKKIILMIPLMITIMFLIISFLSLYS